MPRFRPFRIVLRPNDFLTSMNSTASDSALSLRPVRSVCQRYSSSSAPSAAPADARPPPTRAWLAASCGLLLARAARDRRRPGIGCCGRSAARPGSVGWPATRRRRARCAGGVGGAERRRLVADARGVVRRPASGRPSAPVVRNRVARRRRVLRDVAACVVVVVVAVVSQVDLSLSAYWRSRVRAPEDLGAEHAHEVDHDGVDDHRLRRRGADSHRAAAGRVAVVASRRSR